MKYIINKKLSIALVAILGVLLGSHSLAQTAVGVPAIANKALLTFSVGGDTGLTLNSAPLGNSDLSSAGLDTTFEVDRKIDLSAALTTSATAVPGEDDVAVEFEVTNDTNDVMDFILEGEVAGTGLTFVNTGLTDPTGAALGSGDLLGTVSVFVESGANAGYQAPEDTATVIDDLAIDGSETVYVVVNLDNASDMATDDYLFVSLVARAADAATGTLIATDTNGYNADNTAPGAATPDDPTAVDNVFADGSTLLAYNGSAFEADDKERNGQVSAHGLIVIEDGLEVTKEVVVIFDSLNQDASPKAIPGAFLQYKITIANLSSGTDYTLTTIADTLDGTLSFDLALLDETSCDFSALPPAPVPGPAQTFDPTAATCNSLDTTTYDVGSGTASILEATFIDAVATETVAYFADGAVADITLQTLTIDLIAILDDGVFGGVTFAAPGELGAGETLELVFNVILD